MQEQYRGADGQFTFELKWPALDGAKRQRWQQASNPTSRVQGGVIGYKPLVRD